MIWLRRVIGLAIFVTFLVAGWYFAANNSGTVTVSHPVGVLGEFKVWVALGSSFGLGVALAGIVGLYRGARMRLVARRYRKMLESLQAEVHQLRNLPLAEDASGDGGAPGALEAPEPLERGS